MAVRFLIGFPANLMRAAIGQYFDPGIAIVILLPAAGGNTHRQV
jgi:hypothetical protein